MRAPTASNSWVRTLQLVRQLRQDGGQAVRPQCGPGDRPLCVERPPDALVLFACQLTGDIPDDGEKRCEIGDQEARGVAGRLELGWQVTVDQLRAEADTDDPACGQPRNIAVVAFPIL